MAGLLAKFRIDYSHLKLLSDITKKPEEKTVKFFEDIIKEFTANDDNEENGKWSTQLIYFYSHSYK